MKRYLSKLKDLSLMVVEDEAMQRHLLVKTLSKLGVTKISQAENGYSAINLARKDKPDVVLCDLSMPELDGLGLVRLLHDINFQGSVIFISGMGNVLLASAQKLANSLDLNCIATIEKPYQAIDIARALVSHFTTDKPARVSTSKKNQITAAMLSQAIDEKQIYPQFQLQVDFNTGRCVGVEALARWQHPELGTIMPEQFIPIAEESELMIELTELICVSSIDALTQLPAAFDDISLSINVSPISLSDNLIQYLMLNLKRKTERKITIEVTELSKFVDLNMATEVLARLRMNGFDIALDDYGVGYSSLKTAIQLPLNELKIDRHFVDQMLQSKPAKLAVESSQHLADGLGLRTVAEGISTLEQWQALMKIGCGIAQGQFIAMPVSLSELPHTLAQWQKKYQSMQSQREHQLTQMQKPAAVY